MRFGIGLRRLVICISVLIALSKSALGADDLSKTIPTGSSRDASKLVQISVNASTAHIIQGSVYGVSAELQNVSDTDLTIDLTSIALAVQPELGPPGRACTWYYPAGYNDSLGSAGTDASNATKVVTLKLLPHDSTILNFDLGKEPPKLPIDPKTGKTQIDPDTGQPMTDACPYRTSTWLLRSIDFVPGPYSFVLTGTFHISRKAEPDTNQVKNGKKPVPLSAQIKEDHHFSAQQTMQVGIDQLQTIVYAGFGGVFAFFVMGFRNSQGPKQLGLFADQSRLPWYWRTLGYVWRGAGAFVLSSAVTVVASRLSTTQFPVKVSVDDFWGALTVGFVSFFVGGKFIDKLSDTVSKPT